MKKDLLSIHDLLLKRFGPQKWWPADTEFEVIVGAILTQNSNWKNVERAIANLRENNLLEPEGIHSVKEERLKALIRPAGYYNIKAKKLKEFINFLFDNYKNLDELLALPQDELREQLLSIWGIGPETADSIVLYAAEKPSFVVDAYTRRIFSRLGLVDDGIDYDDLKKFFENNLPEDVGLYREFHALVVELAKDCCRTKPLCGECPLISLCSLPGR